MKKEFGAIVIICFIFGASLYFIGSEKTQYTNTNTSMSQIYQPAKANNTENYCKIVNSKNNQYTVILFDTNKKIVKELQFNCEPYVKELDNHVIQVTISVGSPANYTYLYNIVTREISTEYFNLSLYQQGKVVYMEEGKLIVADAFDKKTFYKEVVRNFSPTAVPSNDLLKAEFIGTNKLAI